MLCPGASGGHEACWHMQEEPRPRDLEDRRGAMERGSAGCCCHSAGQGSTTGTGQPVSQADGRHPVVPRETHWGNGEAELVSSIVVVFTAAVF